MQLQAFKLIVNDPDSILNPLTREVKEVGPDGEEVLFVCFLWGLPIKYETRNTNCISAFNIVS